MRDAAPPAGWYTTAFARPYLTVYAHRDETAAGAEAEFVADRLGHVTGRDVLDLGCGAGRHARALAALGGRVTGLDLSTDLLVRARADGGAVRYVRGDFRALPFRDRAFDHVVSLFTAFGYFDAAGDRAQLAEVARVLRPGGRFVLDFLHAARVRETLVPHSERDLGGFHIEERRTILAGRVEKTVVMTAAAGELSGGDGRLEWTESVRLYDRAELEALVAAAGLPAGEAFGDLSGGAFGPTAPRCVLVCERGPGA